MTARRDQSGVRGIFRGLGTQAPVAPGVPAPATATVPLIIQDATAARIASVSDNHAIIESTGAVAFGFTVKTYAERPIPIGGILYMIQGGAGQCTFIPGAGVTFETSDSYKTRTQESIIAIKHGPTLDAWKALGDLEAVTTAASVIGRSAATNGAPADIVSTANGQYLIRRAGILGWYVPTAAEMLNVAAGNIAATNVQAALNELDTEKASVIQVAANALADQQGSLVFAVGGGTANAITATLSPVPVLNDGMEFRIRALLANTATAVTFNPNALGALTLYKTGGVALAIGDIYGPGHELQIRYRASPARYELINPAVAAGVGGGTWGSITGTLSAQTDLQAALDAKASAGSSNSLYVGTTSTGNVGTGEDVLQTYSLPANSLPTNGDRIFVRASGSVVSNANAKRLRAYFGATVILDTGASGFPASAAYDWVMTCEVIRKGATTQIANVMLATSSAAITAFADTTLPAESLSAAVVVKVSGEAVSNNDIVCESMTVQSVGTLAGVGMTFLGTATVSGAAATTLTLSSLDLSAYKAFFVSVSVDNATGSTTAVSLYYNSDTTATNYYRQVNHASSTTSALARANEAVIISIAANETGTGYFVALKDRDGKPRAMCQFQEGAPSAVALRITGHVWNSAANVTGITLSASVANSLAIGSAFSVFGVN